jgi:ribonuclease HI
MQKLLINVDGASQGNPGEASIGILISDGDGNVVEEISRRIERTTNNIAEYKALIEAIKLAIEYSPERVIIFTDSQLMANQINGLYRVRKPHLEKLHREAESLLRKLPEWTIRFVDREANYKAHRLAQRALLEIPASEGTEGLADRIRQKVAQLEVEDQHRVLEFVNRLLGDQKIN